MHNRHMEFVKATKPLGIRTISKDDLDKAIKIIASIKLSRKERDALLLSAEIESQINDEESH